MKLIVKWKNSLVICDRSQVEIFVNRMKSNSSRGRSIANDSSVQTLFLNITAMHSRFVSKYNLDLHEMNSKLSEVKQLN